MNDVIVIGSNYSTTLGIVRSVGMAGFGVRLLSTTRECAEIISCSKYIVKTVICPDVENSFVKSLEELRGQDDYIVVIPTSDSSMMRLDKYSEELRLHYGLPNVNQIPGAPIELMDKFRQKQLAKSCGLTVAEGTSYTIDDTGIQKAISEAVFPCVTKALASADCIHSKELFRICNNTKDLEEIMRVACNKQCSHVLVEQLLEPEKEYATYGLAYNGKVVMPACVDTWRSGHDTHKGVTAEGVMLSSDFLGEDKLKLEEFVKRTGLNGLFCIDIIQSRGKYYFVELNLRYGASGYAVTMGGANLPGMFASVMYNDCELDESVHMEHEPQFLNEKVEIDDYRDGYMSLKEYKRHQKGSKVLFMKSEEDIEPWKQFKRLERRKVISRLVKGKKMHIQEIR